MNVREAAKALLDRLDDRCGPDPVWKQQMEALHTALAADTVEVPRAPTQEMVSAARRWLDLEDRRLAIVSIYRAMIAEHEQAEGGE